MRFSRLVLQNFRSFGPGKVEIDLPRDENILALVGANNAGKSNVIDALRLVLASGRRYSADPADFHRLDITEDLRIELHLRTPLKRENILRKVDEVHGFFLRAWQADRAPDKGQLKTQHYGFDASGDAFRQPSVARRRAAGDVLPADAEPVRYDPVAASTLVRQLGRVHFLSPSLYRAFETSGYGVLAQLLDLYREDFHAAQNMYEIAHSGEIVPRTQAYDRLAKVMTEVLRTPYLATLEDTLSGNLRAVLGPTASGAGVGVQMPTAEELLADVLRLRVQDDVHSPQLPIDRLGAGYQSLLRIAILRTYADLAPKDSRPSVFLIEEPEAYLNPHLRRYFRTTIEALAGGGNDVVITTHDPALVSLTDYPTVMRITKSQGSSSAHRCTDDLEFAYERIAQKLRRGGNAEVLFAQLAILCEGQDDVAFVRALLERVGGDPDSRSISIIDCGSRDNLPDYIALLDELKIDLIVITDGDKTTSETDEKTAENVRKVAEAAGDRAIRFTENIETALGTEKRKPNAAHLVAVAEQLDVNALPPEIQMLRDKLVEVCPPPPPEDCDEDAEEDEAVRIGD
jgi:putative ATP-dependent endonuclease of the OLD family